jgi:hypothetical protein
MLNERTLRTRQWSAASLDHRVCVVSRRRGPTALWMNPVARSSQALWQPGLRRVQTADHASSRARWVRVVKSDEEHLVPLIPLIREISTRSILTRSTY